MHISGRWVNEYLKAFFHSSGKPHNNLNGSRYSFLFGATTSGKPVDEHKALGELFFKICSPG
jgi:hypothetical protein